ncbi:MAG: 8-amino-7-oxononanoate synthase, partial [Pseudomonadota bacterium]
MQSLEDVASKKLQIISESNLKRSLVTNFRREDAIINRENKELISFSCNDYLGLSQNEKIKEAAILATKKYGVGSG